MNNKIYQKEKIKKLFKKIKNIVKRNISPNYKLYLLGSYIRDEPIHDMDILILNKQHNNINQIQKVPILKTILKLLKSSTKEVLMCGNQKAMAILKNNLKIDLFFFPYSSKVTAKTFLIGDTIYNIIMRNKAKEKGYLLNSYGLFKNGRKIHLKNEKHLHNLIEMKCHSYKNRKFQNRFNTT